MTQKVKCRFEFSVSDSWKSGESACWTECPFSPLIGLGHTCKFLTTKDLKCPFRDNKFKTLIERDCTEEENGAVKLALDLITRQQADNERLKKLLEEADVNYNKCAKRFYKEGVKEFAEKLKFVWFDNRYDSPDIDFDYFVDILVEILVGDTE